MRVGLIAPPWLPVPPPAYGGTESVLDTLARGLQEAGHDVVPATTGDSTCPVPRVFVYERARTAEIGSVVVELHHLLHAYEAMLGAGVDVVHDHTVAGPLCAERFPGTGVITTNHGPFTREMQAIYGAIAHRVPIVAISRHQASTAGPVPVAGSSITASTSPTTRWATAPAAYLLFLGRMSPTKGVVEAIEVARRSGVPLVIAAKMREQPEREYFDAAVAPLLGSDITYSGEVGGAAKLDLLAGAAALLNPIAWDEPFGLCMIEALACGTPVLARPRGAAPEIVDHAVTGFVCSALDDMAAAVADVGTLDRRACRAAVETRFSARRMVADHVALYEHVVAGRPSRASRHHMPAAPPRTRVPG